MTKAPRRGFRCWACLVLAAIVLSPAQLIGADELPAKAKPDGLGGPPLVSAKAWSIIDGETGKFLWGDHETDVRSMASTTKIMTAWLVIDLQRTRPDILKETITVSAEAAKTAGSSAKIQAGDRIVVRDLLHGLLLPSGNDAAAALAEHCGPYYRQEDDPQSAAGAFIAQMNRQAKNWELEQTSYIDPHGLGKNQTTAANLARLAWQAMKNDLFRSLVQTRRYECEVMDAQDKSRSMIWSNTNRLLEIEGFAGIKTGTTTAAGSCLAALGQRGKDSLIVVVLGSTSNDSRYLDSRNLFRWAWRERGHAID